MWADRTRTSAAKRRSRIGLCHARIGIESTAILLAEGTEPFSNMGGINHLDFIPGRIADKSEEIRDLLVARGLLEEVTKQ